mmetsp:Transcript_31809/g.60768  ORF Transcript_31809/g.60768 Transcript_31809/m.60768 type:complete len:429 (-) Transcript_31809:67-1353(-)
MKQSNEYTWDTYKVPQPDGSTGSTSSSSNIIDSGSNTIGILPTTATATATVAESSETTFSIRHLRAGRTGARKTWAAAPALLDYLVLKDGLRRRKNNLDERKQKIDNDNDADASSSVLDMASVIANPDHPAAATSAAAFAESLLDDRPCNILELGGGSGYLSVGLAKALTATSTSSIMTTTSTASTSKTSSTKASSTLKIMCTDMDKHTIKNMRHNICANKETKTVAIEKLDWGEDVGGEKFDLALARKFKVGKVKVVSKAKKSNSNSNNSNSSPPSSSSPPPTATASASASASATREEVLHNDDDDNNDDPVRLLTHVIGSDVHFGETTLGPLSSVIASIKRRNPNVRVIIMMKERSVNSAEELVEQIELKVNSGSGERNDNDGGDGDGGGGGGAKEKDCAATTTVVRVRDVIQSGMPDFRMKLIEC